MARHMRRHRRDHFPLALPVLGAAGVLCLLALLIALKGLLT